MAYNYYKDYDGNNILLFSHETNFDDGLIHLKYKPLSKFHNHKIKICGIGWSSHTDDDGRSYEETISVIVHYTDLIDTVDVINATKKLLTETSFVKDIDYIYEVTTLI